MQPGSRYRWFVVVLMMFFMLLHQADRLLIGPLTTDIMETFGITRAQMGLVSTGALIVSAIFYPLWGYLYDRYARSKLLALAALIWGSTTWLSAIVPSYGAFVATRSATGIDDSSYPGIYSIISDLFGPRMRGKIIGLLQFTQPFGYLLGMVLGLYLGGVIGWRGVYYITGSLGIVVAVTVFFTIRDPQRGGSEPEMVGLKQTQQYNFNWQVARDLFKIPTLRMLFIQGFFGVFPWNVITFWFFNYLETERGYDENAVFVTMVAAVVVLSLGYPLGGAFGDALFRRTPRGRLIVATFGVIMGALLLVLTLNVPVPNQSLFLGMLALTALFIPFAAPNMVSTVYDITLPEVRSTALAIQLLIESSGAALAPLLAGWVADQSTLRMAFLIICTTAWLLCAVFYWITAMRIPADVHHLRAQMRQRAELERQRKSGVA